MDATPRSSAGCDDIVLSQVRVRPIRPDERARWDDLMRRHHYLGFNRTAGRALRQVAEWRGRWLALLFMHEIQLSDLEMEQLQRHLRKLPEPRGGRRQLHRLSTVLTIALAATLAGARGYLAIAEYAAGLSQAQLKRLRAYYSHTRKRFEPPSEPTVRRVLSQVDPDALEQAFAAWVQAHMPDDDALAIDGKTLKGARATRGPVPSAIAWSPPTRSIPSTTPPAFWSRTSRPTTCSPSKTIRKPCLKISKPSTGRLSPPHHTTVDKGHGRIEQRTIRTTALNAYLRFPHVGQVAMVERQVTTVKTGQQTLERVLASIRNFIIGLIRRMITSPRLFIPSVLRYFAARPVQALAVFTR